MNLRNELAGLLVTLVSDEVLFYPDMIELLQRGGIHTISTRNIRVIIQSKNPYMSVGLVMNITMLDGEEVEFFSVGFSKLNRYARDRWDGVTGFNICLWRAARSFIDQYAYYIKKKLEPTQGEEE